MCNKNILVLVLVLASCTPSSEPEPGTGTGGALVCGDDWVDKPLANEVPGDFDGELAKPCEIDADCVALREDAVCVKEFAGGVFGVPGGICTAPCTLPSDANYVLDSPECAGLSSDGSPVDCIGVPGVESWCWTSCESSNECNREGFGCTNLPLIGLPSDPQYCIFEADACCLLDDCG